LLNAAGVIFQQQIDVGFGDIEGLGRRCTGSLSGRQYRRATLSECARNQREQSGDSARSDLLHNSFSFFWRDGVLASDFHSAYARCNKSVPWQNTAACEGQKS
jgi:hypothetical protein